jgi:death on curing protein
MSTWRWVRAEVVYAIHDCELAEHGGSPGILDEGLLEAALARPRNLAAYEHPDAASLAAAYACGLVRNHPFADGNKRTSWVVARLFLADNGIRMQCDPADAVRTMEAAASGAVSEGQLAEWFRERIVRP